MAQSPLSLGELVDCWTLFDEEREQVGDKRGAARLGFALLLKFCTGRGRFPRVRAELPDEAIDFVGRQVQVPASELGFYEWSARTGGATRTLIFRPTSTSAAPTTTGSCANRWTQPSSSTACALSWLERSRRRASAR